MPTTVTEELHARPDGVVRYRSSDLVRTVWLRMRWAHDGRWEVAELYLPPGDDPVSTAELRRIPLGRVQSLCNEPEMSAELLIKMADPGEPLTLEESAKGRPKKPPGRMLSAKDLAEATEAARKTIQSARKKSGKSRSTVSNIEVPDTRPYPDAFYMSVATAYIHEARTGKPASRIAEAAGVPVSTVHGWVAECRRRELLPPARQGKVG